MTRSEKIGHALVALPIGHILGSSLFLWSYCQGFGARIRAYVSASDLLSISITDMTAVYIACAVMLSVLFTMRYFLIKISPKVGYVTHLGGLAAMLLLSFLYSKYIYIEAIEAEMYPGIVPYILVATAVSVTLTNVLAKYFGIQPQAQATCDVLGTFVIALVLFGFLIGWKERNISYVETRLDATTCGKFAVLRKMGDNYLAVWKDNRKAIISSSCEVKYVVPRL